MAVKRRNLSLQTKCALVTGGTGFVGRELVSDLLADGWRVTVLHRTRSSSSEVARLRTIGASTLAFENSSDVTELVRTLAPDVAFHLAAHQKSSHAAVDIREFIEANISLGTYLLEGLIDSGCTVVNAMSYFQFCEGAPAPLSLYAATKNAYLEIARFYREKRGVDIRDVVLYDNYGAGDERDKLIPQLITAFVRDEPMLIGPLHQELNLLHVDDVVSGLRMAAHPGNPPMMTVRAAETCAVADIVRVLEDIVGRDLRFTVNPLRQTSDLVTSSGDWPTPVDWQSRAALRSGLESAYRSYLANLGSKN